MHRARWIALLGSLLLVLAALAFAGCGGDDGGEEGDGETAAATTEEGGGAPEGDAEAGEQIFADNGCGNCHTLEAAGTSGTIGPDLDQTQPSFEAAVEQVTNGGGAMPAFGGRLSEQEIRNVAAYVVESTSG